jgi:hypothetical protein
VLIAICGLRQLALPVIGVKCAIKNAQVVLRPLVQMLVSVTLQMARALVCLAIGELLVKISALEAVRVHALTMVFAMRSRVSATAIRALEALSVIKSFV